MRILRSQYLELQNNTSDHFLCLNNNNGFGKNISNTGTNHVDKEALNTGKSSMVLRRRKNINCLKSNSGTNKTNIEISFNHMDESLKKINVVVEFINMDAMWLTKLYKTYENDLWRKKSRLDVFGRKNWYFYCELCSNVYMKFGSLKSHLNLHMDFYPYACKLCPKKYTGRKSATEHLKNVHNLNRYEWNDFLTS